MHAPLGITFEKIIQMVLMKCLNELDLLKDKDYAAATVKILHNIILSWILFIVTNIQKKKKQGGGQYFYMALYLCCVVFWGTVIDFALHHRLKCLCEPANYKAYCYAAHWHGCFVFLVCSCEISNH